MSDKYTSLSRFRKLGDNAFVPDSGYNYNRLKDDHPHEFPATCIEGFGNLTTIKDGVFSEVVSEIPQPPAKEAGKATGSDRPKRS